MPPTRRHFLGTVAATAALAPTFLRSAEPTSLRAAVIGHTGRGDYGHGLEGIFQNRPGIEFVALADPDEVGRKKIAEVAIAN